MPKETHLKDIAVIGDVTKDFNIYHKRGFNPGMSTWNWDMIQNIETRFGGAALLWELLCNCFPSKGARKKKSYSTWKKIKNSDEFVKSSKGTSHEPMRESYSLWIPYPSSISKDDQVWRMNQFIGQKDKYNEEILFSSNYTVDAKILVIDEGRIALRNNREFLEKHLKKLNNLKYILLKTVSPLLPNNDEFMKVLNSEDIKHVKKVLIIPADHLRREKVQISRSLCWEYTFRDIVKEMQNTYYDSFNTVIVTFETAGALIYDRKSYSGLIYDPESIEGTWETKYPGKVISYATCITAALAKSLAEHVERLTLEDKVMFENFETGIRAGIAAARELHKIGHGEIKDPKDTKDHKDPTYPMSKIGGKIRYYIDQLSKVVESYEEPFLASVKFHTSKVIKEIDKKDWSIVSQKVHYQDSSINIPLLIVKYGIEIVLPEAPIGRFGSLVSIDPKETAQFRALRTIFSEYIKQTERASPLSIAVFGSPGAGKSFAIQQIAESADSAKQIKSIPAFNLSQLSSPNDLFEAFHIIRDVALSGKIPLVFWDEFDTSLNNQELGWLRYFLAPMQDGKFQQGQSTHSIGRAIFVFAGGTKEKYEDFYNYWILGKHVNKIKVNNNKDGNPIDKGKSAKIPDFLSRLRGKVDILGINENNHSVLIEHRRAIILRSLLEKKAKDLFEEMIITKEALDKSKKVGDVSDEINNLIRELKCEYKYSWGQVFQRMGQTKRLNLQRLKAEDGVIRAFLEVKKMIHGTRSMEAIIEMSQLFGHDGFERSCLPPLEQLSVHVDPNDFIGRLQAE